MDGNHYAVSYVLIQYMHLTISKKIMNQHDLISLGMGDHNV